MRFFIILLCGIFIKVPVFASNRITNHHSGISIGFSGQDGRAYTFERWYHDPYVDDHGVVYIRDTTGIRFWHNERNMAWTNYAQSSFVDSSQGTIRFKVDRDLQVKYAFESETLPDSVLPDYGGAPFRFRDLDYGPDDPDVKVVGAVGPKPGVEVTNRKDYYHRGMLDSAGEEWHIITVADGDKWVGKTLDHQVAYWASDGKVHYFIVNPKTPALYLETASADAEFYTTPAKNYFLPKLYEQTTYVTTDVEIHLTNIMTGDSVRYRIDDGAFRTYTGPISSNALSDGEHVLEFYYQDSHHRTRRIVKNPAYPSDDDNIASNGRGHGYLLWNDDAELARTRTRLNEAPASALQSLLQTRFGIYENNRSQYSNGQEVMDALEGTANRPYEAHKEYALRNAFVVAIRGMDNAPTHARYAKKFTLMNSLNLDPIGYELDHNYSAHGSNELIGAGYYVTQPVLATAFAYDLLIKDYRPPQYPDGYTAIEDLKVRDNLAAFALWALMWRAGYHTWDQRMGMWGFSRNMGGLVVAMAMPSYHTRYRGTSGFDGTATVYTGLPFPDQAVTWRRAFLDNDIPLMDYPNQQAEFGLLEYSFSFTRYDGYKVADILDGIIQPDGTTINTGVYAQNHLTGGMINIYSNIVKINFDLQPSYLVDYFHKCLDGTQSVSHGWTRGYYPTIWVINEHYPDSLARKALDTTVAHGDFDDLMSSSVYSQIWFHDDWQDVSIADPMPSVVEGNGLAPTQNPVIDIASIPAGILRNGADLELHDETGRMMLTRHLYPEDGYYHLDIRSVPAGIYIYKALSSDGMQYGKLIKVDSNR